MHFYVILNQFYDCINYFSIIISAPEPDTETYSENEAGRSQNSKSNDHI